MFHSVPAGLVTLLPKDTNGWMALRNNSMHVCVFACSYICACDCKCVYMHVCACICWCLCVWSVVERVCVIL